MRLGRVLISMRMRLRRSKALRIAIIGFWRLRLIPQRGFLRSGAIFITGSMATAGVWARCCSKAQRPLRFEIGTANRLPSREEWALLRAPWELLADSKASLLAM